MPDSNVLHLGDPVSFSAVGNFDDDADLEIVTLAEKFVSYPFVSNTQISIHNVDGSIVEGWPIEIEHSYPSSSPSIGDLDGDGNDEIVVSLADYHFYDPGGAGLYVFDRDSNILEGWPFKKENTELPEFNFYSSPALGDVNNDGKLEISITEAYSSLTYLFKYTREIMDGWPTYIGKDTYSNLIGVLLNNNLMEISGAGGNSVVAREYNNPQLVVSGFPKITEVFSNFPTISDLDHDGKLELIVSSNSDTTDYSSRQDKKRGSIYVWELDAPYNPDLMPWPMFQHDPQHTGLYGFMQETLILDRIRPVINGTLNNTVIQLGEVINATFNATDNINLTNGTIVINDTGFNRYFNFSFEGNTKLTTIQFSQNFTVSCVDCVINITGIARDNSSNQAQNSTILPEQQPIEEEACQSSLECPIYHRCEEGACVGFCEAKAEQETLRSSDSDSAAAMLRDLGYIVIGEANISGFNVQKAGNKIMISSGSEVNVFDQSFDSFVLFDKEGNQMVVQKSQEVFQGTKTSHIIEFEEKPLIVANLEIEAQVASEFGVEAKGAGFYTQGIIDTIEYRLDEYKQRLEEARAEALAEMQQINPSIVSKIINNYKNAFNGVSLNVSEEEALKIKNLPSVKNVYRNHEVRAILEESVNQISADDVWNLDADGNNCQETGEPCLTGEGITIGVIDTGVDYTHADLGGCTQTTDINDGSCSKVIGGYDFINNDNDPIDDQGHGTHVAATAAGNGVLKGVAPDAKIYAYKVLDSSGSGSWETVIAGIERAVDQNQDGNFDDHLDIISLSLGGLGDPDDAISQAIDNAVSAGVVAVVAAGNSGPSSQTIGSPGTARKAITVGAVNKCDILAPFSSRGPVSWDNGVLLKPDLTAPGVNICAAQWDNAWPDRQCLDSEHTAISGTSMATPHVSGAAALLLQAHLNWNPEMIKSVLMSTSLDLGLKLIQQGTGRINLVNANNAELATIPSSISFEIKTGQSAHTETVSVQNLLNEQITITLEILELKDEQENLYDFASLSANELIIDANSVGTFDFIADLPEGLDGRFIGRILIAHERRNYIVPFIFEKLSKLTLKAVTGTDKEIHPNFAIHNEDLSFVRYASYDFDFLGDNFTFKLPSGMYTTYAIGEFESDLEYILMDMIEVPPDSEARLELSLQDARPFTVKAESLKGIPLKLYQWSKGFNTYNNDGLMGWKFHDPTLGDQTVYLSNKPDNGLDTDILLYLHGVPAREEDLR